MTETVTAATTVAPTRESEPVVRVRGLTKRFRRADGSEIAALDNVDLDVHAGEFVVILGPSGCGKTTLLRSIAGLEKPDQGTIDVSGRRVFSGAEAIAVLPERRSIGMVFQSYALWPHMSAFQNVAYPLQARRTGKQSKAEIADQVHDMLGKMGIGHLAKEHPSQMSGGQQQRVALARALVNGERLVLFDEPLSNVDAKVREQLRIELRSMQAEFGFAAIFVTHDQVEAMSLATSLAVMGSGRMVQFDSPQEVYDHPASRYVADFVGTANRLEGTVTAVDGGEVVVDTPVGTIRSARRSEVRVGDPAVAMWRPERCEIGGRGRANAFDGVAGATMFMGAHSESLVALGDGSTLRLLGDGSLADGTAVTVSVDPEHVSVFPAR